MNLNGFTEMVKYYDLLPYTNKQVVREIFRSVSLKKKEGEDDAAESDNKVLLLDYKEVRRL